MLRIPLAALLLLPLALPPGAQEPFEGETLISPMDVTLTQLIDMNGSVLMTWHGATRPASMAYLLDDQSVLRPCVDHDGYFSGGGSGGRIQRIDAGDLVVWDYLFSTADYQQHHDIEPLPNGNVLIVAWERKTLQEAIAAGRRVISGEMWPTLIVEVEPSGETGGIIVWEWHAWDHLIQDADAQKPDYGVISEHPERFDINYGFIPPDTGDWIHINAIDYDPIHDQIAICSRAFGEIYVIDHSTTTKEAAGHSGGNCGMGGNILYRWGNPQTYDRGTVDDQYFFAPHGVNWIDEGLPGAGHILVLNNGDRPGGANDYTTVDELIPPQNPDGSYDIGLYDPFGPATPYWIYGGPGTYGGPTQCGAYRLPNGNTLISYTEAGYIFEVTETGETVWDYDTPGGSRVARAPRYWDDSASAPSARDDFSAGSLRFLMIRGHPLVDRVELSVAAPEHEHAKLTIFDLAGRTVCGLALDWVTPGEGRAVWNGCDTRGRRVAAGTYLVQLSTERAAKSKQLLVIR